MTTAAPLASVSGGSAVPPADAAGVAPDPLVRPSRATRAIEIAVASGLILASAPLMIGAGLLVAIVDGRPVFYRGERLGQGARPFTIAKFRTLRTDAQKRIGGQLHSSRHGLTTRSGDFLRETRIDELPQLFHVLKGDMALFGPRPERREVYEERCREIPGYEDRFRVRPGVFGYSQILTPHGAPKRMRSSIDRRFAAHRPTVGFDLALIGLTITSLLRRTGQRVLRAGRNVLDQRILRRFDEKRRLRRIRPDRTELRTADGAGFEIVDLNDEAILARGDLARRVTEGELVELQVGLPCTRRLRRADMRVTGIERRTTGDGELAVLHYEPSTELSAYVLEQYVLDRSIVQLPRALRKPRKKRAAQVPVTRVAALDETPGAAPSEPEVPAETARVEPEVVSPLRAG